MGALGIMGEMSPLSDPLTDHGSCSIYILTTEGSIPGKWMGDRAIREGRSHKKIYADANDMRYVTRDLAKSRGATPTPKIKEDTAENCFAFRGAF